MVIDKNMYKKDLAEKFNFVSPYKGSGSITREQFLFFETRIVARLMVEEDSDDSMIAQKIIQDNLFQFPTEKSLKRTVMACLRRLRVLEDEELIHVIANGPIENAKRDRL